MADQIKLISRTTGSFAIPELEREVNEWLVNNGDKEIRDISLVSYPGLDTGNMGLKGWIVMIRYIE